MKTNDNQIFTLSDQKNIPPLRTYIAIDLKSFYASVECMERGLTYSVNLKIKIYTYFMKKFLLKLIYLYQVTPFRSHSKCKFYPSCSNYAKEAIETYGCLKGVLLTVKRILKCNPFSKGGIDLVPKK